MQQVLNAIKAHAAAMDGTQAQPRFATVASVDPARHAVRVTWQPEGVLSGWLPVLSPWVGAGWGVVCLPSPGEQVFVLAHEGHSEHGVIVGRAWSDQARVPVAPVGELWLQHATGANVRLCNDGTVRVHGDLHVDGDVYDRHGSLNRLRQHYDGHSHGDAQGGSTSGPDPTD